MKEQFRDDEAEHLNHVDAIIILPFHLSEVVAVDFRKSGESSQRVATFRLEELLTHEMGEKASQVLEKARKESLLAVMAGLSKFSSLEYLVNLISENITAKFNTDRPELPGVRNATCVSFFGPVEALTNQPIYAEIRKAIGRRADIEISRDFRVAIEKLQLEEARTANMAADNYIRAAILGQGDFRFSFWQNPHNN